MGLSLGGVNPATFPPFREDRTLCLDMIDPLTDNLVANGVSALSVLGTTGESSSMTAAERFIEAAAGRLPVIVHGGMPASRSRVTWPPTLARPTPMASPPCRPTITGLSR